MTNVPPSAVPDLSQLAQPVPQPQLVAMSLQQEGRPPSGVYLEQHRSLDSGNRGSFIALIVHLVEPINGNVRMLWGVGCTLRSEAVLGAWMDDKKEWHKVIERLEKGEHPGPTGFTAVIPMSNVRAVEIPPQPKIPAPPADEQQTEK